MAIKAADLIDQAFVNLAVIQPGMSVAGTVMQAPAFVLLNQVLDSLSTEELTVPNQVAQTFALVPGQVAYTLGNGGSWATAGGKRAMKVVWWRGFFDGLMSNGGRVLSLEELSAAAAFALGESTAIPKFLGADTAYPLINVRIGPPPNIAASVELGYYTPLTALGAVGETINIAPGWDNLLGWELALQLYPQYARPGTSFDAIAAMAQRAKAQIVAQNAMKPAAPQGGQQ